MDEFTSAYLNVIGGILFIIIIFFVVKTIIIIRDRYKKEDE